MSFLTWGFFVWGGALAGILSGLFGVGGGVIIVPLLLMQGIPLQQAVGMSLIYILITSISGSLAHWRQQSMQVRAVLQMGGAAVLASFVGIWLTRQLSAAHHSWLFVAFMLLVLGLFAWRQRIPSELTPVKNQKCLQYETLFILLAGLLAGLFASLFGVGGGFVMVPMLVLWTSMNLHQATATSLGAVFLIALGATLQHLFFGSLQAFEAAYFWPLLAMSLAGLVMAPLGAHLNRQSSEKLLNRGFILLTLLITLYLSYESFRAS